jgi:hypothetical protein
MKPPEESEPRCGPDGRRPPEYVVDMAASDWIKDHFPANKANLWDALHTDEENRRDPEPDIEAEP